MSTSRLEGEGPRAVKGSKAARLVKGFRHCFGCAVAVVNVVVRTVGEVQPQEVSTFHAAIILYFRVEVGCTSSREGIYKVTHHVVPLVLLT